MKRLLTLLMFCLPLSVLAIENGEKCTNDTKLPEGMLCHEEETIDCRNKAASQARLGRILCASYDYLKSSDEMTALYKKLLADLARRKPDSGKSIRARDFSKARTDLIASQKAWEASVKLECDIRYELFVGNAAPEDQQSCYAENLADRITWLRSMQEQVDYNPDK